MHGSNKPENNRSLPLLTHEDTATGFSELSGSTQDDFVVVQVSGGCRKPSPPAVVTPLSEDQSNYSGYWSSS